MYLRINPILGVGLDRVLLCDPASLEFLTLLPLPPEFWDYKHVPPHMALRTDSPRIQHSYGLDASAQGEVIGREWQRQGDQEGRGWREGVLVPSGSP